MVTCRNKALEKERGFWSTL